VLTDLVIGVLVLGLLIYRQLMPRRASFRIVAVLGVIGLIETVQYLQQHHGGTATVATLAGSLVLAAAFGAARARTVRVWQQDGSAWSQGSWLTALLWIAGLGAHLGYDALLDTHKGTTGLGNATIVLYLAISLAVQRVIVLQRARRLGPGSGDAPFSGLARLAGQAAEPGAQSGRAGVAEASRPGTGCAGRILHRDELEDLDAEPPLPLLQERVAVGQLASRLDAVGLDDRVAVQVARLGARPVVGNGAAGAERGAAVSQGRADAAHPLAPRAHLLLGLLGRELIHRRSRTVVQQQVLAHR
jgi:hypothetical protein